MNLHLLDVLLIAACLTATIVVGFLIAKRASLRPYHTARACLEIMARADEPSAAAAER